MLVSGWRLDNRHGNTRGQSLQQRRAALHGACLWRGCIGLQLINHPYTHLPASNHFCCMRMLCRRVQNP
jgi:hypothetical protein